MARNFVATLPVPRTSFLDRERERAEIRRLVVDERAPLLTLTGPGGVGKTRLALAVAAALEADADEDVVFVPLAPVREAGLVLPAIAAALGLRESPGVPLTEVLVGVLRDLRLILVLDNLEHVAAAGPDLAWLLEACPRLQIVATSRSRLQLGAEHVFPVPPLPVPERAADLTVAAAQANPAVNLFCQRVRQISPHFALTADTSATVATIVAQLDGLPLAIELAAARAATLPPGTLLARLDRRLRLLTGGPGDAPPRLRSLADAIAWSYDLLTPEQAALFRRLSIFVGGFDADAAIAVAGGDPVAVLDGLGGLIDQSLLYVDQAARAGGAGAMGRLLMLETVREFGLERLAELGEADEASARHAAWAVALAEEAEPHIIGPRERAWGDRLDTELANLRAALGWSLEHAPATTLRLMGALRTYWCRRVPVSEGRRWLDAALAAAPDAPEAVQARAYCALSHIATLQGDVAAMRESASRAIALSETLRDVPTLGWSLTQLTAVGLFSGDLEAASRNCTRAIDLLSQSDRAIDRGWRAYSLNWLGVITIMRGEHEQAYAVFEEALEQARWAESDAILHSVLGEFAVLLAERGDLDRARVLVLESLEIAARSVESWVTGYSVIALACVDVMSGEVESAARALGAGEALFAQAGAVMFPAQLQRAQTVAMRAEATLGAEVFAAQRARGAAAPVAVIANALRVVAVALAEGDLASLLTPREADVVRLLATGMTDREIAAALFISRKTASNHVANILRKLGVETRAAAAIHAVRAGLA